jgi:hypothetical protein
LNSVFVQTFRAETLWFGNLKTLIIKKKKHGKNFENMEMEYDIVNDKLCVDRQLDLLLSVKSMN